MKKFILTGLMMAGIAVIAHAQKGSILLYGNAGFTTSGKNGAAPTTVLNQTASKGSFSINPGVGYQFTDNITAGVEGGYNYADNNNSNLSKMYSVGAFGRYTKSLSDVFSLFGQLGVGYQGVNYQSSGNTDKASGVYAKLVPAVAINVKNGFALNFSFGGLEYSSYKEKSVDRTYNTFGLTFGQGAQFGISKNFGGGKK